MLHYLPAVKNRMLAGTASPTIECVDGIPYS